MDLIVAVDENWGIGKDNDLLYHIPEDMKFFRSTTIEKNVICGKNTLLSFPGSKPLPNRRHLVLTRSGVAEDESIVQFSDLESLLAYVEKHPEEEFFVIGGACVYRQLYQMCKRAYVTKIFDSSKNPDVFFPNLDEDSNFSLVKKGEKQISKNGIAFSFLTYENIAKKESFS